MQAKLHETDNWSEANVLWVRCPVGLTPQVLLYDSETDGTKRYIINLAPFTMDDD